MILVRGGSVLTTTGVAQVDVAVSDGLVTSVGTHLAIDDATVIDATGCWVGPGLVDIHVHFRTPGQTWKEDSASGSEAAVAGGFTAVVAMPNTSPPIDTSAVAREVAVSPAEGGRIEIAACGALTLGRKGEIMAHIDDLWDAGCRMFSDDGRTVADPRLMHLLMSYIGDRGGVVAQHAEDVSLSGDGHLHAGQVAGVTGLAASDPLAEEVIVARDLELARSTGAHYHVQHASTARTVELVRRAKEDGVKVTAEVTPHHLTLDEKAVLGLDPKFKMYPPLRSSRDREALLVGLADGVIDAIACDHAPHSTAEKRVPFENAPRGVIGLETSAALVNEHARLDQELFFERMSVAPARIAMLPDQGKPVAQGAPANLVVFDPKELWTYGPPRSRSSNSPFLGTELLGRVKTTISAGRVAFGGDPAP